jgi:hypothetical protein
MVIPPVRRGKSKPAHDGSRKRQPADKVPCAVRLGPAAPRAFSPLSPVSALQRCGFSWLAYRFGA